MKSTSPSPARRLLAGCAAVLTVPAMALSVPVPAHADAVDDYVGSVDGLVGSSEGETAGLAPLVLMIAGLGGIAYAMTVADQFLPTPPPAAAP